jgi:hypothetical protein
MARSKSKAGNDQDAEGEGDRKPKKAKKKRASSEKANVKVGDISNVPGNVQVAGGDIRTTVTYEEATAARTEKEFEVNELEELRVSLFEKRESLKLQSTAQVESGGAFHSSALGLNQGRYLLGRAEPLRQLIQRLDSEQSVFISGRGGVGRTSLLQAGLMPYLLEQGHLPVLVSLSREALELSIKRNILTRVESTTYLKRLNLAKFLEHAAKFLPGNKRLVLLIDDYENVSEQTLEEQLQAFETEWGLTKANRKLRWLFSIDRGFTARLAPFQPDGILDVPPLDRAAATQVIVGPNHDGLKIEEAYLNEILNELGNHRETIKGASINPSELQVVLRALAESDSSHSLSKAYEEKERVNGIFEDYLVRTIDNNFIPAERPVVWQILTFLKDEYGTPVSTGWIESKLRTYGFETKDVPHLLRGLRKQHVISAKEENYELAHVNLMRGIQKWLNEQTLLKNAHDESIEQLNNIRASALRGLLAGGLGFAVFPWIVGGPVKDPAAVFFFTLLYAPVGALIGLLLTFFIDVFIARYRGSHPLQRYLLSAATGLITFGLGLGLYVYLEELGDKTLLQFILSTVVGGAWGTVTGTGIAWAMSSSRLQTWKIPVIALVSALTLYLFNVFFPVLNQATSLKILVGGFWFPFVILAGILFWKRADPN